MHGVLKYECRRRLRAHFQAHELSLHVVVPWAAAPALPSCGIQLLLGWYVGYAALSHTEPNPRRFIASIYGEQVGSRRDSRSAAGPRIQLERRGIRYDVPSLVKRFVGKGAKDAECALTHFLRDLKAGLVTEDLAHRLVWTADLLWDGNRLVLLLSLRTLCGGYLGCRWCPRVAGLPRTVQILCGVLLLGWRNPFALLSRWVTTVLKVIVTGFCDYGGPAPAAPTDLREFTIPQCCSTRLERVRRCRSRLRSACDQTENAKLMLVDCAIHETSMPRDGCRPLVCRGSLGGLRMSRSR